MLGKTVSINNHPFQIIGVVDSGFTGLDLGQPAQVYVPITMQPQLGPSWLKIDDRRFRWVKCTRAWKVASSVTDASRGHSGLRQSVTEPLLILMVIAGGVLLIVCVNVAIC